MNRFTSRLASELTQADLQDLLEGAAAEDQWLDFKQAADDHNKRHAMLKDVVAFANAEGGYLLLGAEEKGGAIHRFCGIEDARQVAGALFQSRTQNITPLIVGLEAVCRSAPGDVEVVVVRIPPSNQQPHMYTLESRTQFVARYGTHNREMTIDEIRQLVARAGLLTTCPHRANRQG